jgi:peptidoglycan hydrolase-like protein with peptidoglycan-binding domain
MDDDTPGSVDATMRPLVRLPIAVAPTAAGATNTIREPLLPLACWRLDDVRFAFDSSFVQPSVKGEIVRFAKLWESTGRAPASVFGHADPVGDDAYNKTLSGRRALAVYGLLVRDTAIWEELYSQPFGGDDWRTRAPAVMLEALGFPCPGGSTFGAAQDFQTAQGLSADGVVGPATRAVLFERYMDAIAQDGSGAPFRMEKTDFLGRGADDGLAGDVQGCGELNPIRVLSIEEEQAFAQSPDKTERNQANLPNRRVIVLLFPPGSSVDPSRWPCPRAREDDAKCRAQLWADGDLRRSPGATRREYATAKNTFACRFYDGMTRRSPCELVRTTLRLRLHDADRSPLPGAVYRLEIGRHDIREGTAGPDGRLLEADVLAPSRIRVAWGEASDVEWLAQFPFMRRIYLDFAEGDADQQMRKRMANLGYTPDVDPSAAIEEFQRDHALAVTGQMDGVTDAALLAAHDAELTGGA